MPKQNKPSNSSPTVYHTDDTCRATGEYTAGHCTPPFTRAFTAGDAFSKCHHGSRTDWRPSKPKWPGCQNATTAIGLTIISAAALLLITPAEMVPNAIRQIDIPIIDEARRQRASILMLLGSQATLLLILASRPPRGILPIWAAIAAALVPFAAALNQMDKDNPVQILLVLSALSPVLVRSVSILPTGKNLNSRMAFAFIYAFAFIGLPALIVNTRLGPVIALLIGVQATTAALAISITIGAVIAIILFLAAGAIAVGRATRPQ